MLCGSDSIPHNILHIQIECKKYSRGYCQSHMTLLWIWIMLWKILYFLNGQIVPPPPPIPNYNDYWA